MSRARYIWKATHQEFDTDQWEYTIQLLIMGVGSNASKNEWVISWKCQQIVIQSKCAWRFYKTNNKLTKNWILGLVTHEVTLPSKLILHMVHSAFNTLFPSHITKSWLYLTIIKCAMMYAQSCNLTSLVNSRRLIVLLFKKAAWISTATVTSHYLHMPPDAILP